MFLKIKNTHIKNFLNHDFLFICYLSLKGHYKCEDEERKNQRNMKNNKKEMEDGRKSN